MSSRSTSPEPRHSKTPTVDQSTEEVSDTLEETEAPLYENKNPCDDLEFLSKIWQLVVDQFFFEIIHHLYRQQWLILLMFSTHLNF